MGNPTGTPAAIWPDGSTLRPGPRQPTGAITRPEPRPLERLHSAAVDRQKRPPWTSPAWPTRWDDVALVLQSRRTRPTLAVARVLVAAFGADRAQCGARRQDQQSGRCLQRPRTRSPAASFRSKAAINETVQFSALQITRCAPAILARPPMRRRPTLSPVSSVEIDELKQSKRPFRRFDVRRQPWPARRRASDFRYLADRMQSMRDGGHSRCAGGRGPRRPTRTMKLRRPTSSPMRRLRNSSAPPPQNRRKRKA